MKDIRSVLFDAGGTLIYIDGERFCSAAGLPDSFERFAAAEASATACVRSWILSHPESTDAQRMPLFLDELLKGLGVDMDARAEAARRVAKEHGKANLWSRAGRGALETLGTLKQRGYRMGVVSNADGRVRRLLEETGIAPFIEVVVDSAEMGFEKPDPRIFLAATARLGLEPGACAYVGDLYEIDVVGARAAGLHPVLIGADPAPEPVQRVADLEELLALFPGVT